MSELESEPEPGDRIETTRALTGSPRRGTLLERRPDVPLLFSARLDGTKQTLALFEDEFRVLSALECLAELSARPSP